MSRVTEVISRDSAEHYVWGDGCDGWHLSKSPQLSVVLERVPPGAQEIEHHHNQAHQFFFILSGQATMMIGGKRLELNALEGCLVAPKVSHWLANSRDEDLHLLVISAPTSHGDRVPTGPG